MTRPNNDLELLRTYDPAAGIDADPESVAGQHVRSHIAAASRSQNDIPTPRRPRHRRIMVVTVAAFSIATSAAAVAQIGPFADEWDACHGAPGEAGRDTPYPQCAEFVTERVLTEVSADGSAFERQVLEDGRVSRQEYHQAAQNAAACIQDAYNQAGASGVSVEAVESSYGLGASYSFRVTPPHNEFDRSTLPWNEGDEPETVTGDGEEVLPATPLTDEMVQRDPMLRCPAEHFDRIHEVWEAQQIAAQ